MAPVSHSNQTSLPGARAVDAFAGGLDAAAAAGARESAVRLGRSPGS